MKEAWYYNCPTGAVDAHVGGVDAHMGGIDAHVGGIDAHVGGRGDDVEHQGAAHEAALGQFG